MREVKARKNKFGHYNQTRIESGDIVFITLITFEILFGIFVILLFCGAFG